MLYCTRYMTFQGAGFEAAWIGSGPPVNQAHCISI